MDYKPWLIALGCLVFAGLNVSAEVVFEEDFQSEPYSTDEFIPLGLGTIHHGEWGRLSKNTRKGIVVDKDGKRVLELNLPKGVPDEKVRVAARFGLDNQDVTAVTDAMDIRIRFQISQRMNDTFYIQVVGGEGWRSKAFICMDESGSLSASFKGERQSFGTSIEPGVWYELQLLLPANPKTSSIYTANLFEADGESLIDSRSGRMSRSVEESDGNYTAIDIQHSMPGASIIIEKIKATTLPEGLP